MISVKKDVDLQIKSWLQGKRSIDKRYHDTILEFFHLSFKYVSCSDKAWFGTFKTAMSLTVGGIYLSAVNLTSDDTGIWLLLDIEISLPAGRLLPVKSTKDSITPLTWLNLWPLEGLKDIIGMQDVWDSHSRASLKIFNSPKVSAPRDESDKLKGKRLLNELITVSSDTDSILFPDEIECSTPLKEGSVRKVLVNAYERSSEARDKCLIKYGYSCYVCGFDFETTYGDLGLGVIHVHHLIPISQIGEEYEVTPDSLRPVCPNCHTMIHRRNPPYTIEEIKHLLENQKRRNRVGI